MSAREISADDLRARIETALRVRHATDDVRVWSWRAAQAIAVYRAAATVGGWSIETSVHEHRTEAAALAALACSVGLNADGTDPRAEADRLRAAIDDAATTLDGEHIATCMRAASRYAHCDCVIGRVRYALTKAVSL